MANNDKGSERSGLIFQLGMLLKPVAMLASKTPPPTSADYRIATATFDEEFNQWRSAAAKFVIVGGVSFGHELDEIFRPSKGLMQVMAGLAREKSLDDETKQDKLRSEVENCEQLTIHAINQVPIEWQPELLEPARPFSAYLRIRDAIGTANQRLHYFDRYLTADFFPLYLRHVDRSLEIRLVTTKGNANFGVKSVLEVSRLTSKEFSNYQLIQSNPTAMHDRNLRIDETIFHLGASISEAGNAPTNFSPADSSAEAHRLLDEVMSNGIEIS